MPWTEQVQAWLDDNRKSLIEALAEADKAHKAGDTAKAHSNLASPTASEI